MAEVKPNPERLKKESLERLKNAYHQAVTDGNKQQILFLRNILIKLGVTKFN